MKKKVILSMARSGSSNLAFAFKNFSSENIEQETSDGKTIGYKDIDNIDASLLKLMAHDYTDYELNYIVCNHNTVLLYRKNRFERALSFAIGVETGIWQTIQTDESYKNLKIKIDKQNFLDRLKNQNDQENRILDLYGKYQTPIFVYEDIYFSNYNKRYDELYRLNKILDSNLNIDDALKFLDPSVGKLNDHSNIENLEEVVGWYNDAF